MEAYKYQQKQDQVESQTESQRTWRRKIKKQTDSFYKRYNNFIDKYLWNSLTLDEKRYITLRVSRLSDIHDIINEIANQKKDIVRENKIEDLLK